MVSVRNLCLSLNTHRATSDFDISIYLEWRSVNPCFTRARSWSVTSRVNPAYRSPKNKGWVDHLTQDYTLDSPIGHHQTPSLPPVQVVTSESPDASRIEIWTCGSSRERAQTSSRHTFRGFESLNTKVRPLPHPLVLHRRLLVTSRTSHRARLRSGGWRETKNQDDQRPRG